MNKANMKYFERADILYFKIADGQEANSMEISPNITAEINQNDDLIGIEILNASNFIGDSLLDSVQAKMLNLRKTQAS
ncbi:DUF2283 domain-containing protein [Candidatus Saccharibacteria bacterium]|nr:DUF2283 domain-containing protein [Calditrichia bacterium]NIW00166.1 DUF2283 domain-containing protein [Candidatus Saccharibacteria bacterium]NIW80509.1 DUF2283 domain-containing protein [Calditrichia bacterium]